MRLTRAWDEVPDRSTPRPRPSRSSLGIDGLYERDFEQTLAMGRGARTAAHALGDEAPIAAAVSALPGRGRRRCIAAAEEHRAEALDYVDRLSTPSSRLGLEALYLGWPRTTSSTTTKRSPTPTAESRSRARPIRDACRFP